MTTTPLSSILLVLFASLIGSFGAVFLKLGAAHLSGGFRYIFNWQLGFGILLFLGSSVPFVMGIKHGELSVLYPVISLSYVWVAILSVLIFHEHMNVFRLAGISVIIVGVAILGRSGSR